MLDAANCRLFDDAKATLIDPVLLADALAQLSDRELVKLEDELDFCTFAGVPSPRILRLLDEMFDLDARWKDQLERSQAKAA